MSVWQTPHACTRTSTSPARGSASSSSCTTRGWPNSSSTAARIRIAATYRVRMGMGSTTAPLRRELDAALPERPFELHFWDGSALPATAGNGSRPVFSARSPRAVAHALMAPGQLGISRAYVSGELEVDDLDAVLDLLRDWSPPAIDGAARRRLLLAAAPAVRATRPPRRPAVELQPRGRRHSIARDARAVRHHYDVSNDFFELFLGSSMTYSCAIFADPANGDESLEDAQRRKLELVCTKLRLAPGE